MKLTAAETAQLNALCKKFRIDVLTVLHEKQTGHPGGSLSVCEILTTLYFKEMNVRPDEPQWAERDRLVLSKGHAAPMLYRVLAEKGFFPVEEMHTLRDFETRTAGASLRARDPGRRRLHGSSGHRSFCRGRHGSRSAHEEKRRESLRHPR